MKGLAQTAWVEHEAKFQQKFMLCPEWTEAESIFVNFEKGESINAFTNRKIFFLFSPLLHSVPDSENFVV